MYRIFSAKYFDKIKPKFTIVNTKLIFYEVYDTACVFLSLPVLFLSVTILNLLKEAKPLLTQSIPGFGLLMTCGFGCGSWCRNYRIVFFNSIGMEIDNDSGSFYVFFHFFFFFFLCLLRHTCPDTNSQADFETFFA